MDAIVKTPPPETVAPRFAARNLSVLSYADGFTLWCYRAHAPTLVSGVVPPLTLADVGRPGFFDPAEDMLARGDVVLVTARDGAVWCYVEDVRPLSVRLAPMLATGAAR